MIKSNNSYDVCIVGAGVTGLFLASKLLEAGMRILVVESGGQIGGQINLYKDKAIYNIPLVHEIKGCEIIENIKKEMDSFNENYEIKMKSILHEVIKDGEYFVLKIKNNCFSLLKESAIINSVSEEDSKIKCTICKCKYLVLAFGKGQLEMNRISVTFDKNDSECSGNKLLDEVIFYDVKDEQKFKGKELIICGGGDSAIDWACELEKIAKKITVIHRRDIDRPENPMFLHFKQLCEDGKIKLMTPYNIKNVYISNVNIGKNSCKTNIAVCVDVVNNSSQEEKQIAGDFILVFYGFKTVVNGNISIYNNIGISIEKDNRVVVDGKNNETSCKNVFAVGDCCSFDGKIDNIFMGFADAMRCFYEICHREHGKKDVYGHGK